METKIYSFKCGECGKQLGKFSDRESFLKSGIQIMCRTDKRINFAVHRIVPGSVNYTLGKIVEFIRRPYGREKVQVSNSPAELTRV